MRVCVAGRPVRVPTRSPQLAAVPCSLSAAHNPYIGASSRLTLLRVGGRRGLRAPVPSGTGALRVGREGQQDDAEYSAMANRRRRSSVEVFLPIVSPEMSIPQLHFASRPSRRTGPSPRVQVGTTCSPFRGSCDDRVGAVDARCRVQFCCSGLSRDSVGGPHREAQGVRRIDTRVVLVLHTSGQLVGRIFWREIEHRHASCAIS